MKTLCRLLLLVPFAGLISAAEAAPASVTFTGGQSMGNVYVVEETMQGISFVTDAKDPNAARLTKPHGQYTVVYPESLNRDYKTGLIDEASHNIAGGIAAYTAAAGNGRYDWERQNAALGVARLAAQGGKADYANAISVLTAMLAAYPNSVHAVDATYRLGGLELQNGDIAAAQKVADGLKDKASDWGLEASALGAALSAQCALANNQPAAAITELTPFFGDKLTAAKNPEEFLHVGMVLAQAQLKANDPGAMETIRQIAYSPASPAGQAMAQLLWASTLADKGDAASLRDAFDHAAIAASLKDADPSTRGQAVSLATTLVTRIVATGIDDAAKNKLKVEYSGYVAKLQ